MRITISLANNSPALLNTFFALVLFHILCMPIYGQSALAEIDLENIPAFEETTVDNVAGLSSILYEALEYNGAPAQVYAYYGVPSGTMPAGGWPAVVLVHGGGGTANSTWVKEWVSHGYVAIAMDLEGHYPAGGNGNRINTPHPGPSRVGAFNDWQLEIEHQWYYNAVAQIIFAHTLIRSFPQVNADKTGIFGLSWGGLLTSTTMGVDNRFKFAIPIHGSGFLSEADTYLGRALADLDKRTFVNTHFDAAAFFDKIDYPVFWINGTNDNHFSMNINNKSVNALDDATMRYGLEMSHGTIPYNEVITFANQVVNNGIPLLKFNSPSILGTTISAGYISSEQVVQAQLCYTTDTDDVAWSDRVWNAIPATITNNKIIAEIPADANVIYLNATDNRGLLVTTTYIDNFILSANYSTFIIQEDETGFCSFDGVINSNYEGFTGTGFANTYNALGNGVNWEITGAAGQYTFEWRYTNGGAQNRPADLLINGLTVENDIVFNSTGAWNKWFTTGPTTVFLEAGSKKIRLQATGNAGLGNIDYIQVTGPEAASICCPVSNCPAFILNEINKETYENVISTYNYTYWNEAISTNNAANYKFANVTNNYLLSVNYADLSIRSLSINESSMNADEAYKAKDEDLFSNPKPGNIGYAILQNGNILHEKSSTPTSTHSNGNPFAQLPEFGKWCNRRMIDQIDFTNDAPTSGLFTGIEFSNWHNRFTITFQLRLTEDINDGSLSLSVDVPNEYIYSSNNGLVYAFQNSSNKGFALKPGVHSDSVSINANRITVKTANADLIAGEQYSLSLVFYAAKEKLSSTYALLPNQEVGAIVTAAQTMPESDNPTVTYLENEGFHYIDLEDYQFGYHACSTQEVMQKVDLSINNPTGDEKKVKLCINSPGNVTAFSSMINNANGDPSGLHLQVSKNWHGNDYDELYGGKQITLYTEVIVPANTTINFNYTKVGAFWGDTHPAFSHQLSLVGVGTASGLQWLEAGIGGFGENLCHSPNLHGSAMQTDWRPFKINNQAQGGNSGGNCGWTGNLGGMDFSTYFNAGAEIISTEATTEFVKYGPNLSETRVSFYSEDKKVLTTFTFFLNRSDDYKRVYYKVEVKAIENTTFERFDFYQLGDDDYNRQYAGTVAYGNDDGLRGQYTPSTTTDANGYTTAEIALTGDNPWVWGGDGERDNGTVDGLNVHANIGMIIRAYSATFGGQSFDTPYFRERLKNKSSNGRTPAGYSLVTPPEINSFIAGDKIEFTVEATILPKQLADYEGDNENLKQALQAYGNSWELLYRESSRNKMVAASATNAVNTNYPLTVTTTNNSANVSITGGIGYVPVVFSGLTNITNPQLWKSAGDCGDSWEIVDQSLHGKDFWQVEVNAETGLFDLIYNVNQDVANDETATIHYYLGHSPLPTHSSTKVVHIRKRNALDFALDGGSGTDNQNVQLWSQNPNNLNQQWLEICHEGGYYSYQKIGTNLCIDGSNGGADQQNVGLTDCDENNQNQHWKKEAIDSGFLILVKRNALYFVDGDNGGVDSQNVQLATADDASQNVHWLIEDLTNNCEDELDLTGTDGNNVIMDYSAKALISSTQDIHAGATVNYSANEIVLDTTFTVELGAEFTALITECE